MATKKKFNILEICKAKVESEDSIYIWQIEDFDKICSPNVTLEDEKKVSNSYKCLLDMDFVLSPPFKRGETLNEISTWQMQLSKDENLPHHLSVSLNLLKFSTECVIIQYSFSILNARGHKTYPKEIESDPKFIKLSSEGSYVQPAFIELSHLFSTSENYINGNVLRLQLDLKIIKDIQENSISSVDSKNENIHMKMKNLQDKKIDDYASCLLQKIWSSGIYSDVTLECDDVKIPAHKNIICSGSKVFAAMFSNPMKEQQSGNVKITDIDSKTLNELLTFMYTGRTNLNSNSDIAAIAELLNAAEKYDMPTLKNKCWDQICDEFLLEKHAACLIVLIHHYESSDGVKNEIYDFCSRHWCSLKDNKDIKETAEQCPEAFIPLLLKINAR